MTARRFNRFLAGAVLTALGAVGLHAPAAFAAKTLPRLNYEPISATLERSGSSFLPGDADRKYGSLKGLYRAARVAGLDPGQTVSVVEQLPSNAPFIIGRYAAATGELVVEVYKVERTGTQTGVYRAVFTPEHGELWKAAGTYKANSTSEGVDPFFQFKQASRPGVFVNVSFDAAQVIIGHAMRYLSTPMAVLATASPRTEQTMTTNYGQHLRKTVELKVTTYLDPKWYIAAPPSFQPGGSSAAICLHYSGSCEAAPGLIAPAMVTFQEWQGGTLPNAPTLVGTESLNESHFHFESFVAAAYVYTFAASSMRTAVGLTAPPLTENLLTHGFTNPKLNVTTRERAFYSGLPAVLNGGSLEEVQAGYRKTASKGNLIRVEDRTPVAQQVSTVSASQVIDASLVNGGMASFKQYAVGDCAISKTLADCGNPDTSGMLPRADTYVELDTTRFYQDTQP